MKIQIVGSVALICIALGSAGCSFNPKVYYWGDKAYARNPETGKIMSWDHKQSGREINTESPDNKGASLFLSSLIECIAN